MSRPSHCSVDGKLFRFASMTPRALVKLAWPWCASTRCRKQQLNSTIIIEGSPAHESESRRLHSGICHYIRRGELTSEKEDPPSTIRWFYVFLCVFTRAHIFPADRGISSLSTEFGILPRNFTFFIPKTPFLQKMTTK